MIDLVPWVAELTELRDLDEMEIALAGMVFKAAHATQLTLLKVGSEVGDIGVKTRLTLPLATSPASEKRRFRSPDSLRTEMHPDYRACLDKRANMERPHGRDGAYSHLFPVYESRDIDGLLEVRTPNPLTGTQVNTILMLLHIHRNVVTMLAASDRDELTGLWNRRNFNDGFARLIGPIDAKNANDPAAHKRRRKEYVSTNVHLAVIDIDFFKRINDEFGHLFGDEVLVLISRLMQSNFRGNDRIYRFGGEEFVVTLPNTDFQDAEMALERLRAQVEEFQFSQVGRVTVSIGFTSLVPGDNGPAAFGRADQALYVAKHSGRNQVRWYELLVANGTLAAVQKKNDREFELF
jgi:diguanylate cyclase (GGDEF)-like protein